MNKNIETILLSLTNSKEILNIETIQELWGGYGELNRVVLNNQSVIIKYIKYPDEQSSISHSRKVKSYETEINWYKNYNKNIDHAYFPRYLLSGEIEGGKYLIIEDLQENNFKAKTAIQWNEVKQCLRWLAYFHAKHMQVTTNGLWEIGTYWHLDTRPEELNALEDEELKQAAPLIDDKLNSSPYKTIVHGDAKLANFLFKDSEVSAVDFQYVGGGVGVKDLAYFLSSIYDEDQLVKNDGECLELYFNELRNALNPNIDGAALEKDWRELYPYAWSDFYRFLNGWKPGHWKINSYTETMKKKALNALK